jgi:glycosyltransferase involved in cell wall biosynthesis
LSSQSVVEVLLATFNGEHYLREQLDSILAQDYEYVRVLAKDDGSSDGTQNILDEYAERLPDRFRVIPGGVTGGSAKNNFLLLMKESTAEYICFADQDDVWLPHKVSITKRAMDELESCWGKDVPLLVFSDLRVVDDQLRTLQASYWAYEKLRPQRVRRLGALLVQNVVTGCTCMLNRKLVDLSLSMPEEAIMHDHWVALLASAMGKTNAIEAQTVLYRQHDKNVIGSEQRTGSLSEFTLRVRKTDVRRMEWKKSQSQARALLRVHGTELSQKAWEQILAFLRCGTSRNRLVRIWILVRHGYLRTGLLQKLATLSDQWKMTVD